MTKDRPGPVFLDAVSLAELTTLLRAKVVEAGIEQMTPGAMAGPTAGTFEQFITFELRGEEITATSKSVGVPDSKATAELLHRVRVLVATAAEAPEVPQAALLRVMNSWKGALGTGGQKKGGTGAAR